MAIEKVITCLQAKYVNSKEFVKRILFVVKCADLEN